MEIIFILLIIPLALAGIYAFGFSAIIAEKVSNKLNVEPGGFLEWLILAIFAGTGLAIFYFFADVIFSIF